MASALFLGDWSGGLGCLQPQKGSTISLCGHAKEIGSGHLGNKSRSTLGGWLWVHLEKILLLYSSSGNWLVLSPGPPTWELWSETGDTHLPLAQHPNSFHWVLRACGGGHATPGSQSALRGVSRGLTPQVLTQHWDLAPTSWKVLPALAENSRHLETLRGVPGLVPKSCLMLLGPHGL